MNELDAQTCSNAANRERDRDRERDRETERQRERVYYPEKIRVSGI